MNGTEYPLISLFDFYLAMMLVLGAWRRFAQYWSVSRLVYDGPKRWPNLMKLLSQYRTIFWNWSTMAPGLLMLGLFLLQILASQFLWHEASGRATGLTVASLLEYWLALFVVVPLGLAMIGFDLYTLYLVGQLDRPALEKHFDDAEYWLHSRTAHVVRLATFGRINPRKMVAEEVEKALLAINDLLNFTLWWVVIQVGLRVSFGLSLWLSWALMH